MNHDSGITILVTGVTGFIGLRILVTGPDYH